MSSGNYFRGSLGRGGPRGAKNFRGGVSHWRPRADQPARVHPPKPLGETLDRVEIGTLLVEEANPTIKDVAYVASYNWVSGKSPRILVPGSPPAWTPPVIDSQLRPDSGEFFRDLNAARYPTYPIEPTFQAMHMMRPDYDMHSVDVVGCGSTLGNLMRFARSEPKAFRFDVDVLEDTVIFIRKENSPTELIEGVRGFGHTFIEAYTTFDSEVRDSCSHQRIIGYDFGGLRLLVRTETDGYVREVLPKPLATESRNEESLDDALEKLAVSKDQGATNEKLQCKLKGGRVPQEQIFDIKTRSSRAIFEMDQVLPRLWLNQTSKFLIAQHQHGLFDHPQVQDVSVEIDEWAEENMAVLSRFHALLTRIVTVVGESDQQQCEVSWDGQGPLLVTKQIDPRRALPSEVMNLFLVAE